MSDNQAWSWHGLTVQRAEPALTGVYRAPPGAGHAHFWERAVARRQFMRTAAGIGGVVLGARVLLPHAMQAAPGSGVAPRPIPGGITVDSQLFHIFLPGSGAEPSTITDFNGFVGIADVTGNGTGMMPGQTPVRLPFEADVRFMTGLYVGEDGRHHQGTFAFI